MNVVYEFHLDILILIFYINLISSKNFDVKWLFYLGILIQLASVNFILKS